MLNDFKKFILRGNVLDLAVAVVIGAAFSAVVNSLVKDMITPLITAVKGGSNVDFSNLYFTINGSKFMYGDFINEIISFFIMAAVVFFLIIQPVNKVVAFTNRNKEAEEEKEKECKYCFTKIPKQATRCPNCTSKLS